MFRCPACDQKVITWKARRAANSIICPNCKTSLRQSLVLFNVIHFGMLLMICLGGPLVIGFIDYSEHLLRLGVLLSWGLVMALLGMWALPRIVRLEANSSSADDGGAQKTPE